MPDDISQVLNNFKNIMNSNSNNSKNSSEHIDFNNSNNNSSDQSNNSFNITPEMVSNLSELLKRFNDNTSNESQSTDNISNSTGSFDTSNFQIDFDTILKMKSIIEKFNKKDDPRSNLLYSLKPYLRESRQRKIDEYSNLLKIVSMSEIFRNN